ncbi:MAG: anthranilate synthase component I family protein [Chitinophagia bacterium]|nr:anthranilate synthase component I family protein [Chitinophagia bacterium]
MQHRNAQSFPLPSNMDVFRQQLLTWCNQFSYACLLDSREFTNSYSELDLLAAVGNKPLIPPGSSTQEGFQYLNECKDWIFGHFGYHAFHKYYSLPQPAIDSDDFSNYFFFCPETVVQIQNESITLSTLHSNPSAVFQEIVNSNLPSTSSKQHAITFEPILSKTEYLHQIREIIAHIKRGDCYELNYCQPFVAKNIVLEPTDAYSQLMQISPNPFSCFYKQNERYVFCASPERFLQKKGDKLRSQPIKGTIQRNIFDAEQDKQLQEALLASAKNRSENIMVVDLVRNDLSTICKEGTVQVTELLGVYSFPQVHQLISTVEGHLLPETSLFEIFSHTFPMGSMTGAPKKRVMELIDKAEPTYRGIYSGSIGYFKPNKDFDFNVVIRSLVYLPKQQMLRFHVGGGITAGSDPDQEYDECMLKGRALQQIKISE